MSLTDHIRKLSKVFLDPIGNLLHRFGVHPDAVTVFGLVLIGIASLLIAIGELQLGGLLLLVGLPLDAIDGAVARAMKREGRFGAVLDSTLDRYADGFIFTAIGYYFATQSELTWLAIAQLALIGSLLVSYIRARGDGVEVVATVGWFTRLERTSILVIILLLPSLLKVGVVILALGTHLTILQRLWFIYQELQRNDLTKRGE